MIAAALLNGIELVVTGKSALNTRGEAPRLLPQLEPGQMLSARVISRLPDGSFKVDVAGQPLRMMLPAHIAPGDILELRFSTHEPRPTFTLREAVPQAIPAPVLSATGRLFAAMIPQPGASNVPVVASTTAPLLSALPNDGASLSSTLQQSLTQSGLFYEAHQAEWVIGKRDLAQLLLEPQARISSNAGPLRDLPVRTAATPLPAATDSSPPAAAQRADQPMHTQQGLSLVQQQLGILESGRIAIQLEIWPMQWMQWEIDEQLQDGLSELETSPGWHTQLRLDLPNLGSLDAALALGSNGLRIEISTPSAQSAELLHDNRTILQTLLTEAGVPPAAITIANR